MKSTYETWSIDFDWTEDEALLDLVDEFDPEARQSPWDAIYTGTHKYS